MSKRNSLSRRDFVRSSALVAAACAAPSDLFAAAAVTNEPPSTGDGPPIRLGLASYTFRNFSRAQMIGCMNHLNVFALNAKDVKDHLPMAPQEEATALADYAAAVIKLHAAGAIYFANNEDADIRIAIHNHGPEDKLWHSPLDVLRAVKGMDSRIGCCIDVGHTVRAGTDVVQAIHEAGPRLFNVHMKDLTNFESKESQVAVGEGIMPVRKMFEALIATGYKGFVDLEYEIHPDDPMPGVIASFAYMRGVLAGMGFASKG